MDIKISFHHDAGHSWLEIEKNELKYLGIRNKISIYSYMKGNKAYLEEDCDFNLFRKAIESRSNTPPNWGNVIDGIEHPSNCKTCNIGDDGLSDIRDFDRYKI